MSNKLESYIEELLDNKRVSFPFVAVETPDPESFIRKSLSAFKADRTDKGRPEFAILQWTVTGGVVGLNDGGAQAALQINENEGEAGKPEETTANPVNALARVLEKMPAGGILFFHYGNFWLESTDSMQKLVAIQAIHNLRDKFKSTQRMFVLLCSDVDLPVELAADFAHVRVKLPTKEALTDVIRSQQKAAQLPELDEQTLDHGSGALLGLSEFAAEQIAAKCVAKIGFNIAEAWASKIEDINHVAGLRAERGAGGTFENLKGIDSAVSFAGDVLNGEESPLVVGVMDELEKQLGGVGGDTSGTSQDQMAQLLSRMQEAGWTGCVFHGVGGGGKTELARQMGLQAGLFTWVDMGQMKGKYVGESERKFRVAMDKLEAVGGSRVFLIGTCNGVSTIPDPLFRRLSAGVYHFDFPSKEAQLAMWKHYMKKNGLEDQPLPEHKDWTGAEIQNCCIWARRFRKSVKEAALRITPICKIMGERINKMRATASGRFLSASEPGLYRSKQPLTKMDLQRTIESGNN